MRLYYLIFAFILVTSCGQEEKTDDDVFPVPASILTAADLKPGVLKAFDAEKVKTRLENRGEGGFQARTPDDDNDDENDSDCTEDLLRDEKIEATANSLKYAASLDLSPCFEESFAEFYKGSDLSDLKISATFDFIAYSRCSDVDLAPYDGRPILEIDTITDCNQAIDVAVLSENKTIIKIEGAIKGVDTGSGPEDIEFDSHEISVSATKSANGDVCSGSIKEGIIYWKNGCVETSRRVHVRDSLDKENEGKATYQKLEYDNLEAIADTTSIWYDGGGFDVTYNDWTGTVKYSSASSEPIFEMTKGSETVTGTIKVANDSNENVTFWLTKTKAKLWQEMKVPITYLKE